MSDQTVTLLKGSDDYDYIDEIEEAFDNALQSNFRIDLKPIWHCYKQKQHSKDFLLPLIIT
jgi:hypothetical protein